MFTKSPLVSGLGLWGNTVQGDWKHLKTRDRRALWGLWLDHQSCFLLGHFCTQDAPPSAYTQLCSWWCFIHGLHVGQPQLSHTPYPGLSSSIYKWGGCRWRWVRWTGGPDPPALLLGLSVLVYAVGPGMWGGHLNTSSKALQFMFGSFRWPLQLHSHVWHKHHWMMIICVTNLPAHAQFAMASSKDYILFIKVGPSSLFESHCLLKNGGVSPTFWVPGQGTPPLPEVLEVSNAHMQLHIPQVSWDSQEAPSSLGTSYEVSLEETLICPLAVSLWDSWKAGPTGLKPPPVLPFQSWAQLSPHFWSCGPPTRGTSETGDTQILSLLFSLERNASSL